MSNPFFEHPILNSPYGCPQRHWELDTHGQPTQKIVETRRRAEFITPIPKPRKRKRAAAQEEIVFDEGKGLSTQAQQYFLGANDPYSAMKTTLKAEIDPEAWATLNSDTSRPFAKPTKGRIAVKVINHLGDEVMKVFKV